MQIKITPENIKRSFQFYIKNLKKDKRLLQSALNFSQICFENNFLKESLSIVDKIIEMDNNIWHTYFIKAKILNKYGYKGKAIDFINKAEAMNIPQKFYSDIAIECIDLGLIEKAVFYTLSIDITLYDLGERISEKIFYHYINKNDINRAESFILQAIEYFCSKELLLLYEKIINDKQSSDILESKGFKILGLLYRIKETENIIKKKQYVKSYITIYPIGEKICFLLDLLYDSGDTKLIEYINILIEDLLKNEIFLKRFLLKFLNLRGSYIINYFFPYCGKVYGYYPNPYISLYWFKIGEIYSSYYGFNKSKEYFEKFLKDSKDLNPYLKFYANFILTNYEDAFNYLIQVDTKNIPLDILCFPLKKINAGEEYFKENINKLNYFLDSKYKNYALYYKLTFLNYLNNIDIKVFDNFKSLKEESWIYYGLGILGMYYFKFDKSIEFFISCIKHFPNYREIVFKIFEAFFIKNFINRDEYNFRDENRTYYTDLDYNEIKKISDFIEKSNIFYEEEKKTLIASLFFFNGDYKKAFNILNTIELKNENLLIIKSSILIREGYYDKALEIIEDIVNTNNFNIEALLLRCEYFLLKNDYLRLEDNLSFIESINPESFWLEIYKCVLYYKTKNKKKLNNSIERLSMLIKKNNFYFNLKCNININFCIKLLTNKLLIRKEEIWWIFYVLKNANLIELKDRYE